MSSITSSPLHSSARLLAQQATMDDRHFQHLSSHFVAFRFHPASVILSDTLSAILPTSDQDLLLMYSGSTLVGFGVGNSRIRQDNLETLCQYLFHSTPGIISLHPQSFTLTAVRGFNDANNDVNPSALLHAAQLCQHPPIPSEHLPPYVYCFMLGRSKQASACYQGYLKWKTDTGIWASKTISTSSNQEPAFLRCSACPDSPGSRCHHMYHYLLFQTAGPCRVYSTPLGSPRAPMATRPTGQDPCISVDDVLSSYDAWSSSVPAALWLSSPPTYTHQDLRTLGPHEPGDPIRGRYLSAAIVDWYLGVLVKDVNRVAGRKTVARIRSSAIHECLIDDGWKAVWEDAGSSLGHATWLIPVLAMGGNHWIAASIQWEQQAIFIYESASIDHGKSARNCASLVVAMIQTLVLNVSGSRLCMDDWSIKLYEFPRQPNNYDCGLMMLLAMRMWATCSGTPMQPLPIDYRDVALARARRHMVVECVLGQLSSM